MPSPIQASPTRYLGPYWLRAKINARLGWSGGASRRPADRALSLLSLVVTDTKSKAARPVPRFNPGARWTNRETKPEAKPQKVKRAGFGGARGRTAPGASCLEWNRRTCTPSHHPNWGGGGMEGTRRRPTTGLGATKGRPKAEPFMEERRDDLSWCGLCGLASLEQHLNRHAQRLGNRQELKI